MRKVRRENINLRCEKEVEHKVKLKIMSSYFYIDIAGNQKGGFTLEELKNEPVKRETLVWTQNMPQWARAEEVNELSFLFAHAPPPLPPLQSPPPPPQQVAIFCHSCGTKMVGDSKFCINCGTNLSATATTNTTGKSEISLVQNNTASSAQMEKAYVKCQFCNESFYFEDKEMLSGNDWTYNCDSCQEEIEITFFGRCWDCKEYVGFRSQGLAKVGLHIAKAFAGGFLDGILGNETVVSQHEEPKAIGDCPFCLKTHIQCPECRCSVKTKIEAAADAVYSCSNCRTKMSRG